MHSFQVSHGLRSLVKRSPYLRLRLELFALRRMSASSAPLRTQEEFVRSSGAGWSDFPQAEPLLTVLDWSPVVGAYKICWLQEGNLMRWCLFDGDRSVVLEWIALPRGLADSGSSSMVVEKRCFPCFRELNVPVKAFSVDFTSHLLACFVSREVRLRFTTKARSSRDDLLVKETAALITWDLCRDSRHPGAATPCISGFPKPEKAQLVCDPGEDILYVACEGVSAKSGTGILQHHVEVHVVKWRTGHKVRWVPAF